MNTLRHIRTILYGLKKHFATTVVIVKLGTTTYDLKKGTITCTETKTTVKAIVLPTKTNVENQKNDVEFTGKLLDCIIDRKDYTTIGIVTTDDYIEFRGSRWVVKSIESAEHDEHVVLRISTVDAQLATT